MRQLKTYDVHGHDKSSRFTYAGNVSGAQLAELYHEAEGADTHDVADAVRWAVANDRIKGLECDASEPLPVIVIEKDPDRARPNVWLYHVEQVSTPRTVVTTPTGMEV